MSATKHLQPMCNFSLRWWSHKFKGRCLSDNKRVVRSLPGSLPFSQHHRRHSLKILSRSGHCSTMAPIERKIINSENAAKPVAPYNQAVQIGQTMYLSGVLGLDKDTMKLVDGGIKAEAEQAFINMGHILEAGSSCFGNVVKTTVFLADINEFKDMNEIYQKYFKEPFPARSAFQVGNLPMNARVEIEAIAAVGQIVCKQ